MLIILGLVLCWWIAFAVAVSRLTQHFVSPPIGPVVGVIVAGLWGWAVVSADGWPAHWFMPLLILPPATAIATARATARAAASSQPT